MDTKKIKLLLLSCLVACQFAISLHAATLTISKIQTPVWLERNGTKIILTGDTIIQSNDQLQTGSSGKLRLQLQNNRKLTLGNNTRVAMNKRNIELLAGVIRLSPGESVQSKTSTQLKTSTAIINTKNADLWSEATAAKKSVVLISGSIEINHDSGLIVISEALTTFEIDVDNSIAVIPPHPVNTLDLGKLLTKTDFPESDEYDANTEKTRQAASERYIVYLYSTPDIDKAKAMNKKLQAAGHPCQLFTTQKNNTPYYRLGVSNFESLTSAKKYSARVKKFMKLKDTWIDITKQ